MSDVTLIQCKKCSTFEYAGMLTPVLVRLPGRPANNGRSHAYGGKPEMWCGKCRFNYLGSWKHVPKAKKKKK